MKTLILATLLLAPTLANAIPKEASAPIPVTLTNKKGKPLGYGYNAHDQRLMGYCVDNAADNSAPPIPVVNVIEGRSDLQLSHDESEVADKLELSGTGRFQTGVTEVSLATDFYNGSKSSDYRTSFTFIAENQYRESMDHSRINPIRPYPDAAKYMRTGLSWYDHCGDEFVQSRIWSARLFVNVSISFVSKEERDRFTLKFNLKSPTLDLGAAVDKDHSAFSAGNRMTVQAYQIGGDTSYLGRTLCPATVDEKPDPDCDKGSLAIVQCAFSDLKSCNTMLASAIAYGNGHGEGQFGKQIEGRKNFSLTSLETVPYDDVVGVFPATPDDITLEIRQKAWKTALELFNSELKIYSEADALKNGQAPRLSISQQSTMELFHTTLFNNMLRLTAMVEECYDEDPKACAATIAKAKHETGLDNAKWESEQNLTLTSLSKAETYVQYCDIANDNYRSIQRTVGTLRNYIQSKAKKEDFDTIEANDRCLNEAQWLEAQTEIEIPASKDPLNPTIGDLGPLAALKHLKILHLPGQSISDVKALRTLVDIEELNLDDNLVSDVTPLAELKTLRKLSLQNNQLSKLTPLAKLKGSLRLVDASGNDLDGTACPLASPANCQFTSFRRYADISTAYTHCDDIVHPTSVAVDDTHILATGGRAGFEQSARIQLVDNQGCRALPSALAAPRVGHTMTMTPGGVLVIGGGTDLIERINPRTYEVSVLPGRLAANTMNHTATLISGGRVLVVGGASDSDPYAALTQTQSISGLVQVVNPDGTVETIGQLNVPRSLHTATLLQDGRRVLIVGGYSLNQMIDIAEIIDPDAPAGQRIQEVADTLPFGRAGHVAMLLGNGHVLIAGGSHWELVPRTDAADESRKVKAERAIDQVLDFDPARGTFRSLDEKLPVPVSGMQAVATSDHRLLLIGGMQSAITLHDGSATVHVASTLIQVFDPQTLTFYKVSDLLNRRTGFTATALPDNRVLVFGGTPTVDCEVTKDAKGNVNGEILKQPPLLSATELLVYRPR